MASYNNSGIDKTEMRTAIFGSLLCCAIGDAMGLPMEGISKSRQKKLFPGICKGKLIFGRSVVSDDTEHAFITAASLLKAKGDVERFSSALGKALLKWLLCLPPGVGYATLKSLLKLSLGISANRSGVFSAGNGPAMRASIIGICYGDDPDKMKRFVRASTRITHTDPRAEYGAVAVALAAYMSSQKQHDPSDYLARLKSILDSGADELVAIIANAVESIRKGESTEIFAGSTGLKNGVTGYMYHTVPIALHAWFSHPADSITAIQETIRCGGDTDTTAAIAGGIIGASVEAASIPDDLKNSVFCWPTTFQKMEEIANNLSASVIMPERSSSLQIPYSKMLIKNIVLFPLILLLGLRRLFPPY